MNEKEELQLYYRTYDLVVKKFTPSGMVGDDESAPSIKEIFSKYRRLDL